MSVINHLDIMQTISIQKNKIKMFKTRFSVELVIVDMLDYVIFNKP